MAKVKQKEFKFNFPLNNKVIRSGRIVTVFIGDLEISGVGYCDSSETQPYSADIDFIKWNGTDVKQLLEVTSGLDVYEESAKGHVSGIFEVEKLKAEKEAKALPVVKVYDSLENIMEVR